MLHLRHTLLLIVFLTVGCGSIARSSVTPSSPSIVVTTAQNRATMMPTERVVTPTVQPDCGPPPTKDFEQRTGSHGEYCILWRDTFTDEHGFRITLEYGSLERFTYDVPANTTWFAVPWVATPQAELKKCARSSYAIGVTALRPDGETIVNGIGADGECRP